MAENDEKNVDANKSDNTWLCPPIISNIFRHLSAHHLSICAQVCSLWNEIATTERKRRQFVEWFFQEDQSDWGKSSNRKGLLSFQEKILAACIRPSMCMVFLTQDSLKPQRLGPKRLCSSSNLNAIFRQAKESFSTIVPNDSEVHLIPAPGIIGCDANLSPFEIEDGIAFSGFLLPDFPGVQIRHCPIFHNSKWDPPHVQFPIKGLLIFATSKSMKNVQAFVNECSLLNNRSDFAMGGAIVHRALSNSGSCFLCSGENLQMASVVIDDQVKDIAKELFLFKTTGLLEDRQCFALMFVCVARGYEKHGLLNYESTVFRNLYPNVPLCGVFGEGEMGVHYLPNVGAENKENKARQDKFGYKDVYLSYTSVFVLFSVKIQK